MLKDALNFLRLKVQDVEHYDKHPMSSILLIFILLEIPTYFIDGSSIIEIISNVAITLLVYLFFIYWIFRKVKTYSFILACKFFGILLIGISIPLTALQLIGTSFEDLTIVLSSIIFMIYITGISTSKAMGVSKTYALSGIVLSIVALIILFIIYFMIEMMILNV
jgi:hypothetical protein